MTHDYTGCQDPACEGYSAGKAKALFECAIATCHISATPECRCSPCTALRYAIHSMSQGEPPGSPRLLETLPENPRDDGVDNTLMH